MKVAKTFFALLTGLVAAQSAEVMGWVPPYGLEKSRKVLQSQVGGIKIEEWMTRMGLQLWLVKDNGDIEFATAREKFGEKEIQWFKDWAKAHNVKVLLTIFNYDKKWNWPLAKSAFVNNRARFVKALIDTVDKFDLDGVDLDLEGNGNFDADRADFAKLVADLSKELKARGKLLTVDSFHSPCTNAPHMAWWSDWKGQVDALHSMGYGDLYEGSTTTLEWCMKGVKLFRFSWQAEYGAKAGYRTQQVLMGVPGYQYEWGSGGKGASLPAHLEEIADANAGLCVWDIPSIGEKPGKGWDTPEAWKALKAFREGKKIGNNN